MVGMAVGDALGAPFEFGPPLACGGGGWDPGEATDDTQMAVLVGLSLTECGGFDPADMFARFQRWAAAEPKDIGLQTEAVLTSGLPWNEAAADHAAHTGRAAGNGSLMRTISAAVYFAQAGQEATMRMAREISALTHGDPAAGEGCAVYHDLIRVALDDQDPLLAIPAALDQVAPHCRDRWAVALDPSWSPEQATQFNGAVWPALGTAIWAVRTTNDFEAALRRAVDAGGDTDTVAAITGGLAGAVYGVGAIPERWSARLHVPLPGHGEHVWRQEDLRDFALRLDKGLGIGRRVPDSPSVTP
jgi:ADP-ribosyl-[dinitrogen reductase] hydrolase